MLAEHSVAQVAERSVVEHEVVLVTQAAGSGEQT
jgi:hypothetical protein